MPRLLSRKDTRFEDGLLAPADPRLAAASDPGNEDQRDLAVGASVAPEEKVGNPGAPPVEGGPRARMSRDELLDLPSGAPLRGTPYRVLERLGAGGMGAVFEGEHVRLKRRVCIKVIHPGLRGRSDFLARMEIEAQTLARLDHPGIVKVFDLGVTDDGIPYFVMERLEGKDLRRLLASRRFLSLPDALAIVEDVLEAVAHAHREGVVHRDLKPENIFLAVGAAETVTKVLDFGIAHVADDRRGLTGERFVGTCQYAAPEQLQGLAPTEKTDIYAVGCILYELVVGRRPFAGPKTHDYIRQHLEVVPPRLSTFAAVPQALDDLVASALEKDPKKRPATALWFAAQLHQIQQVAHDVELATANTTEEMLLTAVTEGAGSSGGVVNDTVRDHDLSHVVRGTTPVQTSTEPMAPALDPRSALTRTSSGVELPAPTERLVEDRAATPPRISEDLAAVVRADSTEGEAARVSSFSPSVRTRTGDGTTRGREGRHPALWPVTGILTSAIVIAGLILVFGESVARRAARDIEAPAARVVAPVASASPSASERPAASSPSMLPRSSPRAGATSTVVPSVAVIVPPRDAARLAVKPPPPPPPPAPLAEPVTLAASSAAPPPPPPSATTSAPASSINSDLIRKF